MLWKKVRTTVNLPLKIDVTAVDKTERTLIHNTIKVAFSGITGSTIDQDGKKFIKCSKQKKNGKQEKNNPFKMQIL